MKRFLIIALSLCSFAACQKAPELTLSGSANVEVSADGGSSSITFTANRDWSASSSDSWIHVSPSSGSAADGQITVSIRCDANTTYDDRSGTVTIRAEELTQTISVKQPANLGLIVSPTSFDVSNKEQTIAIKAQANVQYSVEVDVDAKSWISLASTKALTESTVNLSIAKNEGYDRTGKVTLKYNNLQEVITIKQKCGDVVFDDVYFKAYCVKNFDNDNDGEVSINEANLVEKIDISNQFDIKSVGGVEFFTNLRILNIIATRSVTYINLSKNTALTELNCEYNQLESLDISNNTALTKLFCSDNQLTSLDVSKNTALTHLHCFTNQITSLDVSKNTDLTELVCGNNQITNLDISRNTVLTKLDCGGNPLSGLDVSNNTALTELSCWGNQLTSLDISKNTALSELGCYYNRLTSLDVSNNTALTKLLCSDNQLTSLDVSQNVALSLLACYYNRLTSLDISKNTALTQLVCSNNRLTNLDVGNNTLLTELGCQDNLLKSLDVSKNTALEYLGCTGNPYLVELWLKKGQLIPTFYYDPDVTTIKYK